LEVRVWVFGSSGLHLGVFVSGSLVTWVSPFDLLFFSHFKFLQFFLDGDVSKWDWRLQNAPFADGLDPRGSLNFNF
jgi:hypothetical protein